VTDDVLLDALDRLRDTGPEFDGFLANHGPMAAEAMIRLAADERVARWVDRYRTRLAPAPEVRIGIGRHEWRDRLGDVRLLGDWAALFRREASERTWTEILAIWWPRLLPGMAASATHGVIRTAHAVRSLAASAGRAEPALVDELAQGLALWAARYQPLPGWPSLAGPVRAVDAIAGLPRLDATEPAAGPGIAGRLAALVRLRPFADGLDTWAGGPDPDGALDDLIGAATRVLAARADAPIAFCHAVTAPAAVRLVLPHLPESYRRPSVAASWQVVGAIVAAFAAPGQDAERLAVDADAGALLADLPGRAVEHGDEHVIKLTEAAMREYARTGDVTLLVAADRFRGRIPATP
jgi:Questin oxidase-like